jgi:hypothetical protein
MRAMWEEQQMTEAWPTLYGWWDAPPSLLRPSPAEEQKLGENEAIRL